MSASNRNSEGRSIVGHGVLAAFYVQRGGTRRSGAAACLLEDSADAPGQGIGGR